VASVTPIDHASLAVDVARALLASDTAIGSGYCRFFVQACAPACRHGKRAVTSICAPQGGGARLLQGWEVPINVPKFALFQ